MYVCTYKISLSWSLGYNYEQCDVQREKGEKKRRSIKERRNDKPSRNEKKQKERVIRRTNIMVRKLVNI